jgi:hypothetical protein
MLLSSSTTQVGSPQLGTATPAVPASAPASVLASAPTSASVGAPAFRVPRRPSYLWAQNRSHLFITVALSLTERHRSPIVTFEPMRVLFSLPAADGGGAYEAVGLDLELLRRVMPEGCSCGASSRGPLLRLRKQREAHWPRLLRGLGPDTKQGVDWSRWSHPAASQADRSEALREEFGRLTEVRSREIGAMLPRFEKLIKVFDEAWQAERAVPPMEQTEMLHLGERAATPPP